MENWYDRLMRSVTRSNQLTQRKLKQIQSLNSSEGGGYHKNAEKINRLQKEVILLNLKGRSGQAAASAKERERNQPSLRNFILGLK